VPAGKHAGEIQSATAFVTTPTAKPLADTYLPHNPKQRQILPYERPTSCNVRLEDLARRAPQTNEAHSCRRRRIPDARSTTFSGC